ncbi:type III secretion protein [Pseudomonas gingeri]|uniref:type III secretion protein n=1 Tax=Pseudomonas gingeri TaxID=117681 RepID=UPI0015A3C97E|nr:type III secretion protein [Pseudomonas gingeri]NWA02060.1 type III secretion protein [Pseudomonas gingeri]NWA18147.1 type III secretion protein [Pseudomonas gingeri]NWA56272.1 type III secretion protein [Pseudomonas gingeri]NWA98850.1 type III secretion protein [Pseudomonas gingeri]NWB04831.1 type III secretion protein [Pseudomonas gingeri]
MDEELEADPNHVALTQVIQILTPLRQHRQASAERAQRRLQEELETMRQQLLHSEQSWVQERDNQRVRRQQLSQAHLRQTLELNEVERWHEKERRMLDRLAFIQQDVSQLRQQIELQQQRLEQARMEARARQRAVEKLACMSENLNEE